MEAALVKKYEDALSRDPNSRVFAQLGELYRKMGMHDRAMIVYRDGVKRHPSYVLGYLGLAFCYYDLEQFQLAYATLRPLVDSARDNLRLQKLFARCCENLNYKDEALETWKYLLFINPKDNEAAAKVTALESSEQQNESEQKTVPTQSFKIDNLSSSPIDDVDDWVRVDLAKQEAQQVEKPVVKEVVAQSAISLETSSELDEEEVTSEKKEAPIVSLTLVDLYIAQGHHDKAQEILEKMLELNPSDERVILKLAEIKQVNEIEDEQVEDDGHSKLLKLVEEKQGSFAADEDDVEIEVTSRRLDNFLQNLKRRAQEKSAQT